MFAAEYQPAQITRRRRSTRTATGLDAQLGEGGLARTLCKVVDVSIHGARLQTYSLLMKGAAIWLTLPGIGGVAATVMWADDYLAGCRFVRPLDPVAYAALIERDDGAHR